MNALRQFDLGPGSSPLDVAAGNGDLGILPAHARADVTAVDSPTMIERLDKRAAHSGRLDVEAQVFDGVHLDFNCDSFAAHLAEMTRVGRHGARSRWFAQGATDEAEFRTCIESGELTEVGITSQQVERDGEFTVVDVGIGAKQ